MKKPIDATATNPLPPEPNLKRAERLLLELLAIPGVSGQEGAVAGFVTDRLRRAGAPKGAIESDQAHRRSPSGGEVGTLVCRLDGTRRGPRRLLMAHMDTVPLCAGAKAVVRGRQIVPAAKDTALGADDRSGVAVVLGTALEILERGLPHPPLSFFFTVEEELGLLGMQHAKVGMLGHPRLAFNFDGGPHESLVIGATGDYRLVIDIEGIAAHAGCHPECGASAITIASLAIASLHAEGWLGRIEKDGRTGTSNVGVIEGGGATNVVTPRVRVRVRAEARSHDPAFRKRIVRVIEKAFRAAAKEVRTDEGESGRVGVQSSLDYESFVLGDDEPCVLAAEAAIRAIGGNPVREISNGGLDANWMTALAAPTVTLGAGQYNAHTVQEVMDLAEFRQACRVALRLATATEA
ncbi:MAG: M20/M25/M40 family metallo-hydrolase [Planctomycetia bacterium]|nr:M20/M25/M40 family metallo-hydrolase [Planctomycetia bacterium]